MGEIGARRMRLIGYVFIAIAVTFSFAPLAGLEWYPCLVSAVCCGITAYIFIDIGSTK